MASLFMQPMNAPHLNTVVCAYSEGPLGEGISNAWKVKGENGKSYIVKFYTGGDRTALNELLCAHLSMRFGLPLREPALIRVGKRVADGINNERRQSRIPPIDQGVHFGVVYKESFTTVESFQAKMGRDITPDDVNNLEAVPDILAFDTLVNNNDRHCGNVELSPSSPGGRLSYVVFDFGLAFGGREWSARSTADLYRDLPPITQFCLIASKIRPRDDFARFTKTFEAWIMRWIDEFLDDLPPEWGSGARQNVKDLRDAMSRLTSGKLVDAIRLCPALRVD